MGMTTWVVPENSKKMTLEHRVFERMDVFLTMYKHESSVFFREWTFLSYGNERNDFFLIIEIKRVFPSYFFGQ